MWKVEAQFIFTLLITILTFAVESQKQSDQSCQCVCTTNEPKTTISTTSNQKSTVSTTSAPKIPLSCLIMFDAQTLGEPIIQRVIDNYHQIYTFSKAIGDKLFLETDFNGTIDWFGYSPAIANHQSFTSLGKTAFDGISYPYRLPGDFDDDGIDLQLTEALSTSLNATTWVPPVTGRTCLIFISAAKSDDYSSNLLLDSYNSFDHVLGVVVKNGDYPIPGNATSYSAPDMTADDVTNIVKNVLNLTYS